MEDYTIKVNKVIVNIIKSCIDGYNILPKNDLGRKRLEYIMGQAMRQYYVSEENMHVSKLAMEAWNDIIDVTDKTYKEINSCNYRELLKIKDGFDMQIPTFKGSQKNDLGKLDLGEKQFICFNELFIAEHTTPISDIKKILLSIDNANINTCEIARILNKIHITRMLRIEDRRILACSSRLNKINNGHDNMIIDLLHDASKDVFAKLRDRYYYQNLKTIEYEKYKQDAVWPEWALKAFTNDKIEILK